MPRGAWNDELDAGEEEPPLERVLADAFLGFEITAGQEPTEVTMGDQGPVRVFNASQEGITPKKKNNLLQVLVSYFSQLRLVLRVKQPNKKKNNARDK